MKTLPKYYCIKRDESNPLWKKYIDWLNETYNSNWNGDIDGAYYGFQGHEHGGTQMYSVIENFKNNPELITLDFWDECVNGRKIVGYKAPFDMYGKDIEKGELFTLSDNRKNQYRTINGYCMPKELVETWEVVYEEEKLEVKSWGNVVCGNTSNIVFKGKLTQEKVDKIKDVVCNG